MAKKVPLVAYRNGERVVIGHAFVLRDTNGEHVITGHIPKQEDFEEFIGNFRNSFSIGVDSS